MKYEVQFQPENEAWVNLKGEGIFDSYKEARLFMAQRWNGRILKTGPKCYWGRYRIVQTLELDITPEIK